MQASFKKNIQGILAYLNCVCFSTENFYLMKKHSKKHPGRESNPRPPCGSHGLDSWAKHSSLRSY